jgi:hypothetical protein
MLCQRSAAEACAAIFLSERPASERFSIVVARLSRRCSFSSRLVVEVSSEISWDDCEGGSSTLATDSSLAEISSPFLRRPAAAVPPMIWTKRPALDSSSRLLKKAL